MIELVDGSNERYFDDQTINNGVFYLLPLKNKIKVKMLRANILIGCHFETEIMIEPELIRQMLNSTGAAVDFNYLRRLFNLSIRLG